MTLHTHWLTRLTLTCLCSLITCTVLASDHTRTLTHALGNTSITGTPTRIVTLYQGATDTAVALGITPVGVVDSWLEQPTYQFLREQLANVTHVGLETQPNLELIASLQPDLIIAAKMRHEKIYPQLSQIAPTISIDYVFQFKDTVQQMGTALNRQTQADELLNHWTQRVADFQQQLKTTQRNTPNTVSLLDFRPDHVRLYLQDSFAGSILTELGFTVARNQGSHNQWALKLTSRESMPSLNADVFFIFKLTDDPVTQRVYQQWTQHPLWQTLTAVQQQQVFFVDEVAWSASGGVLGANKMLDQVYQHFGLTP